MVYTVINLLCLGLLILALDNILYGMPVELCRRSLTQLRRASDLPHLDNMIVESVHDHSAQRAIKDGWPSI